MGAVYRIWSKKRSAWWMPGALGYTTDFHAAGTFSEAEAREIEKQSSYGPAHLRSVAVPPLPSLLETHV